MCILIRKYKLTICTKLFDFAAICTVLTLMFNILKFHCITCVFFFAIIKNTSDDWTRKWTNVKFQIKKSEHRLMLCCGTKTRGCVLAFVTVRDPSAPPSRSAVSAQAPQLPHFYLPALIKLSGTMMMITLIITVIIITTTATSTTSTC